MKRYLAIDSATRRATLAIGPAGAAEREVSVAGRELSGGIERLAGELLIGAGIAPGELAGVVVADGPGSFTGLRIGIAFAKGLCRATDLPLLVAPSMLGAAYAASRKAGESVRTDLPTYRLSVVVDYDALRGEVYRAVYGFQGGAVVTVVAPALAPAGSSADGGPEFVTAGEDDASAAALLGLLALAGGTTTVADGAAWEPSYGRPAEAEARRLMRGGGHER